MISSQKYHMSSLANSLNYRHAGRTLSTLPFNLVKNVKITPQQPTSGKDNWKHMVFSLDKKYLRNNALAFNEFKKNTTGQAMFKSFAFFIQMAYRMQDDSNGDNFACFLEWVKSSTTHVSDSFMNHCGIRVHIFSAAASNDTPPAICDQLFGENRTSVVSRKVRKNWMDHDLWKTITSRFEYARQVADVYTHNFEASSQMDSSSLFNNSQHKANPLYVFRLESNGFPIEGACDLQCNADNYHDSQGNIIFPDESRIYRMMPTDLLPDRFFFKYLPDYFFTRIKFPDAIIGNLDYNEETRERTFELAIDSRLERDRYNNYLDSKAVSKKDNDTWVFNARDKSEIIAKIKENFIVYQRSADQTITPDAQGTRKWLMCQHKADDLSLYDESRNSDSIPIVSPLIETLLTNKHSLSDLDVLKIRAEYKLGYCTDRRQFQEAMVREFCERVWDDEEADISAPGRSIILWKQHMRCSKDMSFQFKKLDENMSVFANRAIRIMDFYDKELFVSAQHKTLFLLQHAKYDAYRTETNLHFNQIYTGEGATSKSFLFEKMEEQSISGTVETLTYQTKRADAVDGDLIDIIQVFNEAPPGMFMTNKNSDGEAEAMFKEKLTSQVVRCKEFYRDENTGERKNRIAKSQCIGVVMGATNDNPSTCSEAMVTRFFWGQFEKVEGSVRSIQECMRGERDMKTDSFAMGDKSMGIRYAKEEQMRVWLVFKFMFMKILHKPTLKAADVVYDQLSRYLKRRFKVSIPPRTKERYEILCTIFTIVNALEIVFNIQGGLHAGKPEVRNESGEVIQESQPNEFHPEQLLDIEPHLYCTEEIAIFAFSHIQEEFVNPNEYKVLQSLWNIHTGNRQYLEERQTGEDGAVMKVYDYSYCQMNRFGRLLTEIANNMPVESGRMSKHNIEAMMNSLKDLTIKGHVYRQPIQGATGKYNDGLPEPTDDPRKKQFAVKCSMEGTFVHMDLFDEIRRGVYVNKVKESLRSLEHKFSYQYRNHMLGSNIRARSIVKYPNLFDTIELSRGDKVISLKNPLYVDSLTKITKQRKNQSEKSKHQNIAIKVDLTIASAATHAKKLDMPVPDFIRKYTEKMMKFEKVPVSYNYPDDYIKQYNRQTEPQEDYDEFDSLSNMVDQFEPSSKRARIK